MQDYWLDIVFFSSSYFFNQSFTFFENDNGVLNYFYCKPELHTTGLYTAKRPPLKP